MNKYDLTKLEDLATGFSSPTVTLSPETVFLCLLALEDRARFRGAWLDNGNDISDSRWDVAENIINVAIDEISSGATS